MVEKIKVQRDYYVTEASAELPARIEDFHQILQLAKTNGKLVVQYNQGCVQGINIEQRTKIPENLVDEFREKLGIATKIL